jgi:hypothetical protein
VLVQTSAAGVKLVFPWYLKLHTFWATFTKAGLPPAYAPRAVAEFRVQVKRLLRGG